MTARQSNHEAMARMWREKVPASDIAREFSVRTVQVYRALRKTGDLPPYGSGAPRARIHHERIYADPKPKVEPTRVDRDSCWRCGTRADIGCRHRKEQSDAYQA